MNALRGLAEVFRKEINIYIHLVIVIVVLTTGVALDCSTTELALLALTLFVMMLLEIVNTAIERLADAVCPEHHPLIGKAKDIMAGAVLFGAISAAIIIGLILAPKLF